MSVKCLAIGDPHFQVSTIPQAEILIEKLHYLVDNLQSLDFVVILGDLLHTHEKIHVAPLKTATHLIVSLAEKIPVYLIIGNHDQINNQQFLTENHAFNSFKKIAGVIVCDTVVIHIIKGQQFCFCPYVPPGSFLKALNTVGDKWKTSTCIFAHQEFFGCRFNPTMTSLDGDVWDDDYPLVISGHIHDSQWLQNNIYYVGSSMQHAFGESADKTIALLKFKNRASFKLKKIDLELQKKRIIYKNISELVENDFVAPTSENVAIKLVIKGSSDEFKVFRKSLNYKKLMATGIKISFTPTATQVGELSILETPNEKKSVIEILKEMIANEDESVKNALSSLSTH